MPNTLPDDGLLRFADGRLVGGGFDGSDVCPDCAHQRRKHNTRYGCQQRLGSSSAPGGEALQMLLGPCGCTRWCEVN